MLLAQLAVFVLIVQLVIRPVMAAYLFTRPPRLKVTFRTPADWDATYRDVVFDGAGGVKLEGWYVPSRNGAAVVLLHGHSGNRLAVAFHAEALSRAGYGVLLFDLRAHGGSGGRRFARGEAVIEDVLAAVAFVSRQRDVLPGRIGVMGVSVGGMLAIQAAARTATIRAVAADGPILGAIDDLPPPGGPLDLFLRYPLERYYQAAIDWFSRSPRPPANTAALARIRRPILFISAGRGMEQRLASHFFAAAGEPKQWWAIPHAAHAAGWVAEPAAYARQLTTFFDRALAIERYPEGQLEAEDGEGGPAGESDMTPINPPEPEPVVLRPIAERTVRPTTAMMFAFATIPAAILLLLLPFQWRWGLSAPRLPVRWEVAAVIGFLALLIAGLLLHEALHLAGYRLFGRVPRGAARLSLGRAAFAPQVSCEQPITAAAYRWILALPGLVLGVLPGLLALATGSWVVLIWAIWSLVEAAGDLAGLWAMRGLRADAPVRAHPNRIGCQVFGRQNPLETEFLLRNSVSKRD
jgi:dienelactone hydrolase